MDSPVVKYAVPAIGNLLGAIMLLSPCKAVWNIRKTQQLGVSAYAGLPHVVTCSLGTFAYHLGTARAQWCIYQSNCSQPLLCESFTGRYCLTPAVPFVLPPQAINPLPYPLTSVNCLG